MMDELENLYTTIQDKYYVPGFTIKRDIKRSSLLRYFFIERPEIKRWNRKHNLLTVKLFKVELSEQFKFRFDDIYIKYLLPIKSSVEKILEEGWKFSELSVTEYNILVLFKDFLDKLDKFGERKTIHPKLFFLMEEAFLKLLSSDEYVQTILVALEKVFLSHKNLFTGDEEKIKELVNNVHLFFLRSDFYPSIYHFILAYNIFLSRRMTDWDDISGPNIVPEVIQTYFYDCSYEVFRMIVLYSRNLKNSLSRLEKDKSEIEWIRNLMDFSLIQKPVLIVDFLNKNEVDWAILTEDFFYLMISLFKIVLEKLEQIIYKNWTLIDSEESIIELKIIHNISLEVLYKKMFDEYYKAKARFSTNVIKKISLEEFFNEETFNDLIAEANSNYIYQRFSEVVGHMYELSYIFRNIYNEREKKDSVNRYLNYMIESPQDFLGRPVFAVFKEYSELFMQIAGFFRNKDIEKRIGRLENINNEIDRINRQIERIMDQDRCLDSIIGKSGIKLPDNAAPDEQKEKEKV